MIKIEVIHSGGTIDATADNYGEVTIEKSLYDLPRIGTKLELGGTFIFRGATYEALLPYSNSTRNLGADLTIKITKGSREITYFVDTDNIKWNKEICQCEIGDGSMGGLTKMYDDLELIWDEDINIDLDSVYESVDLDLQKPQYRVDVVDSKTGLNAPPIRTYTYRRVETYGNAYNKVTQPPGNVGFPVTDPTLISQLKAIVDADLGNYIHGYYTQETIHTIPPYINYTDRRVFIINGDEIAKPRFQMYFSQNEVGSVRTTIEYYYYKQILNEHTKLKKTMKVDKLLEFFCEKFFGADLVLDSDFRFRPQSHTTTQEELRLVQKSNVKRPWGVSAFDYEISFRDLIETICKSLRIYYFISKRSSGEFVLSFFNPKRVHMAPFSINVPSHFSRGISQNTFYNPYFYNSEKIEIPTNVENVYKFKGQVPISSTIEFKEHKTEPMLRNEYKLDYGNGTPEKESITLFNLDINAVMFLDFPSTIGRGFIKSLPFTDEQVMDMMELVSNEYFSDSGYVMLTDVGNLSYSDSNVLAFNTFTYYPLKRWVAGTSDAKIFSAEGGVTNKSLIDFDKYVIIDCDLPSEKNEVNWDNGYKILNNSSYDLVTGVNEVIFQSR